jgi:AbrB family looped-hinge helix DNA binding protein
MLLKIDDDGILTFPDEVIDKLGWKEGDILEWHPQEDGSILVVKVENHETENRCDSSTLVRRGD